jgi:nitronate monooxygenase
MRGGPLSGLPGQPFKNRTLAMASQTPNRLLDLFGVELPVIQAPMAGATTPDMVIATSNAGGLGSLPSALYSETELRAALDTVRAGTRRPINVNFFAHVTPTEDPARQAAWRRRLTPYYVEAGLDPDQPLAAGGRAPFDAALCAVVEDYRPEVVSFHFGLPAPALLDRVKRTGAKVLSSATTLAEALWLEAHGVDAVIAMGAEAGGHRGNFLTDDMSAQVGTFALLPRIADAVSVPVIAAGGIADRRGSLAAFTLGADAVQVGTAYLLTPEAKISALHRQALTSGDDATAITNLFTGRPARGIVNRLMAEVGPLSDMAPAFPTAGAALAPLRAAAEAAGRGDFSPLWAGQAFRLAKPMSSADLTRSLGGAG